MDVVSLASFREVCARGSISAAAQRLGYTQSAVSRQIAALEARFEAPLLERHARGVRTTPAGEALLRHATAILRRVERAEQDVAASREAPVTTVRVGAVPSAAAGLLPRALGLFAAREPRARAVFTEDVTPRLLPGLLDGESDVVVVTDYPPGIPARPDLSLTHLLDDPLVCVLPAGHRLAGRAELDLVELRDEIWVEDYDGSASALTLACARAGFTPAIGVECGSWLGKQAFVAAGQGVMLAPRLLVPALRPGLAASALTRAPYRRVYAAVRRLPRPAAGTDTFVAALAEAAAEL
ncbi:LysR substrate-binding domain-containing protein [Streptomyces sp. NPDC006798]|uniref:LysR family transcriptional regulator n=1 Tax=Streptomyces sp. NPDC006798 TaxID=3155462 RepID=UPI0033C710C5